MRLKKRYATPVFCFFIASAYAGNKNTIAAIRDLEHNLFVLCLIFFVFITGLVALVVRTLVRHNMKRSAEEEKQKLLLDNKLLETQLRVNRSLMSPHFVYNSLNSLQNFILGKDHIQANNYLVKFSKLMRGMLESNMSSMISLAVEMELTERYLEIESLRFEEKFMYTVSAHPSLIPSAVYIPVMMVQPFIENAIWHGLLKKTGEKKLSVYFAPFDDGYIQCVIEDNGLGLKKDHRNEPDGRPHTIDFISQRLELLNQQHHLNCRLVVEDKPDNAGTSVTITLPLLKYTLDAHVAG